MDMLTKQDKKDIKDIVIKVIEPMAVAIQADFVDVKNEFSKVNGKLGTVEKDVKEMKTNSGELFTKIDKFIYAVQKCNQETAILAGQVRSLDNRVAKTNDQT